MWKQGWGWCWRQSWKVVVVSFVVLLAARALPPAWQDRVAILVGIPALVFCLVALTRILVEMGQEIHRKIHFVATVLKGIEQGVIAWWRDRGAGHE